MLLRRRFIVTLLTMMVVQGAAEALAQPRDNRSQPITPQQVRDAISRGVKYLLDEQSASGRWIELSNYQGGVTALCTLALLNAGVPANHPQLKKSLDYLMTLPPGDRSTTYGVSLQTMSPNRSLAQP